MIVNLLIYDFFKFFLLIYEIGIPIHLNLTVYGRNSLKKNTNITPLLYSNFLSFLMHFNETPQEKNSLNQKQTQSTNSILRCKKLESEISNSFFFPNLHRKLLNKVSLFFNHQVLPCIYAAKFYSLVTTCCILPV